MGIKLDIWNQRMLLLMQHCIDNSTVDTQKDFLESLGLKDTALRPIRIGERGFTVQQIVTAAKKYKVNPGWILGLDQQMRIVKNKSALQNLKDAVRAVEAELVK